MAYLGPCETCKKPLDTHDPLLWTDTDIICNTCAEVELSRLRKESLTEKEIETIMDAIWTSNSVSSNDSEKVKAINKVVEKLSNMDPKRKKLPPVAVELEDSKQ